MGYLPYLLNREHDGRRFVPITKFEGELIKSLGAYLKLYQSLEIAMPIYVFLTLLGAKDCWLGVSNTHFDGDERYAIDRDVVLLQEGVVLDYSSEPAAVLRPLFDMLWNTCGYPQSRNYDASGAWTPTA